MKDENEGKGEGGKKNANSCVFVRARNVVEYLRRKRGELTLAHVTRLSEFLSDNTASVVNGCARVELHHLRGVFLRDGDAQG